MRVLQARHVFRVVERNISAVASQTQAGPEITKELSVQAVQEDDVQLVQRGWQEMQVVLEG
jgi:hypothetical protein